MSDPKELSMAILSSTLEIIAGKLRARWGHERHADEVAEAATRLRALTEWRDAGEVPDDDRLVQVMYNGHMYEGRMVGSMWSIRHIGRRFRVEKWRELPTYEAETR